MREVSPRSLRTPAVLCRAALPTPGPTGSALAHGAPGSRRFPRPRGLPAPAPEPRGATARPRPSGAGGAELQRDQPRAFQRVSHARQAAPGAAPAGGLAFPPPWPEPARTGGGAAGGSTDARPRNGTWRGPGLTHAGFTPHSSAGRTNFPARPRPAAAEGAGGVARLQARPRRSQGAAGGRSSARYLSRAVAGAVPEPPHHGADRHLLLQQQLQNRRHSRPRSRRARAQPAPGVGPPCSPFPRGRRRAGIPAGEAGGGRAPSPCQHAGHGAPAPVRARLFLSCAVFPSPEGLGARPSGSGTRGSGRREEQWRPPLPAAPAPPARPPTPPAEDGRGLAQTAQGELQRGGDGGADRAGAEARAAAVRGGTRPRFRGPEAEGVGADPAQGEPGGRLPPRRGGPEETLAGPEAPRPQQAVPPLAGLRAAGAPRPRPPPGPRRAAARRRAARPPPAPPLRLPAARRGRAHRGRHRHAGAARRRRGRHGWVRERPPRRRHGPSARPPGVPQRSRGSPGERGAALPARCVRAGAAGTGPAGKRCFGSLERQNIYAHTQNCEASCSRSQRCLRTAPRVKTAFRRRCCPSTRR